MSRIGRKPIQIPAGVDVKLGENNFLSVKGPKGTLEQTLHADMIIKVEGAEIIVERPSEEKEHKALHGLTRSLVANMVEGVTNGYSKKLEINGVGYRAELQGAKLVMNLGYSHNVTFEPIDGIKFEVPDANTVIVSGCNKQQVGQVASEIRSKRPPEPYLGKGIKYSDEYIKRKSGKAGK